ncbi:MAG: triose-phosphate isomerase [Candidatus Nanohaloarchaea archaeon]
MIIVNFKAYKEATGKDAEKLSKQCRKASKESGEKVVSVPQHTDVGRMKGKFYGQHLDPVEPGSHTGHTTAEALKASGASGTLINHSERRIDPEKIERSIERAKEKGLTTVVCAQSPEECEKFSKFEPDFVAFEPPELIGGNISVSSAKPDLIKKAVEKSEVDVLTGAGIKSREDVEKSIELGCKGVLVASAVVKAENTYEEIMELCKGL